MHVLSKFVRVERGKSGKYHLGWPTRVEYWFKKLVLFLSKDLKLRLELLSSTSKNPIQKLGKVNKSKKPPILLDLIPK